MGKALAVHARGRIDRSNACGYVRTTCTPSAIKNLLKWICKCVVIWWRWPVKDLRRLKRHIDVRTYIKLNSNGKEKCLFNGPSGGPSSTFWLNRMNSHRHACSHSLFLPHICNSRRSFWVVHLSAHSYVRPRYTILFQTATAAAAAAAAEEDSFWIYIFFWWQDRLEAIRISKF